MKALIILAIVFAIYISEASSGWKQILIDVEKSIETVEKGRRNANVELQTVCECGVEKNERVKASRTRRIAIKGGAKHDEADADRNEYPWQVFTDFWINGIPSWCGGSIISKRTILTAAHCIHKKASPNNSYVYVGLHNVGLDNPYMYNKTMKEKNKMEVARIILHPNFKRANFDNDAALLILKDDITWNNHVKPICLPENNSALYEGVNVTTAGWGRDYYYKSVEFLREAEMKTMSNKDCSRTDTRITNWIQSNISGDKICAFSKNQWTCAGDSGGPLITKVDGKNYYEQIGVVSFSARGNPSSGPGYCKDTETSPGVFVRVTAIMDWINDNKDGDSCVRPS